MPKKPSPPENDSNRFSDPHFEREAAKYGKPIPSRESILQYLQNMGKPVLHADLLCALKLEDEADHEALRRRLRAMERDGQVHRNRRGAYGLSNKMGLIRGRIHAHKDGFGFLIPDDGSPDLFLPEREMRQVFHGDKVLARKTEADIRGRPCAAIVDVLQRTVHQIVGRFHCEQGVGFVIPQNPKLQHTVVIPTPHQKEAQVGQIVVVRLLSPPTKRFHPTGEVIEVLGTALAPGMEIDVAIRQYDLPHQFEEAVLAETQAFSNACTDKDRLDLREKPFVTIDGEDAQDFDDAVYVEPKSSGGFRLWVAIADVSHYVTPGSALDQCAQERGNSVYFPGKVIPMLPERLSNDLCSLRPHCDRLVVVAICDINTEGKLGRYQFKRALIHSHARLTYSEVAAYLENGTATNPEHALIMPSLGNLHALFLCLLDARKARGAIDFTSRETRIVFDDNKRIARIALQERNVAHKIVEECMLMANVAAARFLIKHKIPALYRVHDSPPPDQIRELREHLSRMGIRLGGGEKPAGSDFSAALEAIRACPDLQACELLVLRSMAQASYSPNADIGHFGLAYPHYTHFTSPIRRYPDIVVHRALLSEWPPAALPTENALQYLEVCAEHCSLTERKADDATRDVISWLKCDYMKNRIGQTLDGKITGVTNFGLFVELKGEYVEGLVHIASLKNDYYAFDPGTLSLRGERSGIVYRLGMLLRVTVAQVDLDQRKIDFVLASESTDTPSHSSRPHQKANASHETSSNGKKKRKKAPKRDKERNK